MMEDERMGLPSASGLHRLALCPGSWAMERQCPEQDDIDAESGTRIHQYLCDRTTVLSPDELDIANACIAIRGKVVDGLMRSGESGERGVFSKEERMPIYGCDGSVIASAKHDLVLMLGGGRFLIIDYKTGNIAPDPVASNWQIKAQVAALAQFLDRKGIEWDGIYAAVVQPLVTWEPAVVCYRREHASDCINEVYDVVSRATEGNQALVPTEGACRHCRAQGICPASVNLALSIARVDLPGIWKEKSPEEKRRLYDLAVEASKVADRIKLYAKADLEQGGMIDGLSLKAGARTREVADVKGAYAMMQTILSPDQFISCCSVKLSELASQFHMARCLRHGANLTKKSSDEILDKFLDPVLKRGRKGKTIAASRKFSLEEKS